VTKPAPAGLWQAARMHDERKQALINTDRRRLVRAATRLLGPAEAEDAVQDAYLRALEAGTQELNAAQAWLLAVMRNLSIDRLRRRQWLQQWLTEMNDGETVAAPSAESDAALAQEITQSLRRLAVCLTAADGAAVLLHEVFEMGHPEIAQAGGRSEAASRQQLRRSLLRLRQAVDTEPDAAEENVFRLYLQSMQLRDPQALWAMLRQPPISATSAASGVSMPPLEVTTVPPASTCGVVQVGGQLALVLTLDGVRLCVLPLGARPACEAGSAGASSYCL
jgi:RNA polymerase sigma factor (sigma-70 family)